MFNGHGSEGVLAFVGWIKGWWLYLYTSPAHYCSGQGRHLFASGHNSTADWTRGPLNLEQKGISGVTRQGVRAEATALDYDSSDCRHQSSSASLSRSLRVPVNFRHRNRRTVVRMRLSLDTHTLSVHHIHAGDFPNCKPEHLLPQAATGCNTR